MQEGECIAVASRHVYKERWMEILPLFFDSRLDEMYFARVIFPNGNPLEKNTWKRSGPNGPLNCFYLIPTGGLVSEPTFEVKSDPQRCVENDCMQECMVRGNGALLEIIENPSEKIRKLAVQQNFQALQYIPEPSEEVIDVAAKAHGLFAVFPFMENPDLSDLEIMEENYLAQIEKLMEKLSDIQEQKEKIKMGQAAMLLVENSKRTPRRTSSLAASCAWMPSARKKRKRKN